MKTQQTSTADHNTNSTSNMTSHHDFEDYTLKRFYLEASALLDKHQALRPGYRLMVAFEVEDDDQGTPQPDCVIWYKEGEDYTPGPSLYADGSTPTAALKRLEENLLRISEGPKLSLLL